MTSNSPLYGGLQWTIKSILSLSVDFASLSKETT